MLLAALKLLFMIIGVVIAIAVLVGIIALAVTVGMFLWDAPRNEKGKRCH